MSLVKNNSKFHGFEPTIHTLELRVRDLQLSRGWWAEDRLVDKSEPPRPVGYVLRGRATTGADTITIIGSEEPDDTTQTLEFCLIARTHEERVAQWEELKQYGDRLVGMLEDPADTEQANLVQFLRNVNEGFEGKAPTVLVQRHKPDPELSNVAPWSVFCEAQPDAFDAIITDINAGRCTEIACSIELSPLLTDSWYAPISEPTTIGLLKQGKHDDGSSHGWVKSLQWATIGSLPPETTSFLQRLAAGGHGDGRDEEEGVDEDIIPSSQQLMRNAIRPHSAISSDAAMSAIASLATTTKRGFWMLLILILLVVVFR
jgi:hypothetical protein